MSNTNPAQVHECPACGASVPAHFALAACPACSAPLTSGQHTAGVLTPAQRSQIRDQVTALNEKLMEAGAKNAEYAFNLGCSMSSLLVLASGILVYFLAGRNWVLVIITVIMAFLAALWLIILTSNLAKTGAIRQTYHKVIGGEINDFTQALHIDRLTFEEIAHRSLPESAPLRQHISPLPAGAGETTEEQ